MGKGDNGGFSQEQIDMYKECFKLMDVDIFLIITILFHFGMLILITERGTTRIR